MSALNFFAVYPKGDQDALFDLGDTWKLAAAELEKLEPELRSATDQVPQYYLGEGATAITQEFATLFDGQDHSIQKLVESLTQLGHDSRSTATEIEYTKIQSEVFALLTLYTIVQLSITLFGEALIPGVLATARASLATFSKAAMARIAAISERAGLQALAKPLVREIAVPVLEREIAPLAEKAVQPLATRATQAAVKAVGAGIVTGVMGAGLDAGTQAIQIMNGHRDDGFDLKQTFQTSLQWGAGGLVGAPFHGIVGNALKDTRLNSRLGGTIAGGIGGGIGAVGMYGAGLGTQLYNSHGDWSKVDKTFHSQLLIGGLAMGAGGGANHGLHSGRGDAAHSDVAAATKNGPDGSSSHTSPADVKVAGGQPNHVVQQELQTSVHTDQPLNRQPVDTANGGRAAPSGDTPRNEVRANAPAAGDSTVRPSDAGAKLGDNSPKSAEPAAPRTNAPAQPAGEAPARAAAITSDHRGNIVSGTQDRPAPVGREIRPTEVTADTQTRSATTEPATGQEQTPPGRTEDRTDPANKPATPDRSRLESTTERARPDTSTTQALHPEVEQQGPAHLREPKEPAVEAVRHDREHTDDLQPDNNGTVPDTHLGEDSPAQADVLPAPVLTPTLGEPATHPGSTKPGAGTPRAADVTRSSTSGGSKPRASDGSGARAHEEPKPSLPDDPHTPAADPSETVPSEHDWSPRPDDEWSRLDSQQVADELANRWGIDVSGFDNPHLDPEVAREFARAIDDMLTRYPDVDLGGVAIEPINEPDVYAATDPGFTSSGRMYTEKVILNERYALDIDRMIREIAEDEADGHLVPGSADRPIHSSLVHEFGHVLDNEGQEHAERTAYDALADHFESTRGELDPDAFKDWLDQLSGYSFEENGTFEPSEALAEAFLEVEYHGEAATEPAKVLYWHLLDSARDHGSFPDGFEHLPNDTVHDPRFRKSSSPSPFEPQGKPHDSPAASAPEPVMHDGSPAPGVDHYLNNPHVMAALDRADELGITTTVDAVDTPVSTVIRDLLPQHPELAELLRNNQYLEHSLLERPKTLASLLTHPDGLPVLRDAVDAVTERGPESVLAEPVHIEPTPLTPEDRAMSREIREATSDVPESARRQPEFDYNRVDDPEYQREFLQKQYDVWRPSQDALNNVVRDIATETEGKPGWREQPKDETRAWDKIRGYDGDVSRLTDLVGAKIVFDHVSDAYRALEMIENDPRIRIVEFEDRFDQPQASGYRDLQMKVQLENGHIAELRLHLSHIDAVANYEHGLYEVQRDFKALAKDEHREMAPAEAALNTELKRNVSERFWEATQKGLPDGVSPKNEQHPDKPSLKPRKSRSPEPEPTEPHPAETLPVQPHPVEGGWAPDLDDGWSAMNAREIADEVHGRWGIEVDGFDNPELHPEVVREFARAVDDMLSQYPGVTLPKISIERLQDDYHAATAWNRSPDGRVHTEALILNETSALNPEVMARESSELVADGHFVPGSTDRPIYSSLVHEFGHVLDVEGQLRATETALDALDNYYESTRGGMDKAAYEQWLDQLSGYSFDHGKFDAPEAVAEAFADVQINGEAASEPAKVLYQHLLDNANIHPDRSGREPVADSSKPEAFPDRTTVPTELTPELRGSFESLREQATEIVRASADPTRADELANLHQKFAERYDELRLRDPDTATPMWQLFHEHDPALAKYVVDNGRSFLPSAEETPSRVPTHSEPDGHHPVSDEPGHRPDEPGLTPTEQAAKDACDQLPQAERLALDEYAGPHYNEINRHLRFGEDLRAVSPETIDLIRSGLDKLPDHVGPVKRSITLSPKDLEKFWYENRQGAIVEDPGFVSTSKTKFKWNPNVKLTIVSATGKDISFLRPPERRGEAEVLIPDGRQFRVLDREMGADGTLHITWEEVTESTRLSEDEVSASPATLHDSILDEPFPLEPVEEPHKGFSLNLPDSEQAHPDVAPHVDPDRPPTLTQHLKDRFEQVRTEINDVFVAYHDPARAPELPGLRAKFGELFDTLGLRDPEAEVTAWQLFNDHDSTLAQYVVQNRDHLLPPVEDRAEAHIEPHTNPSDHPDETPIRNDEEQPRPTEDHQVERATIDNDDPRESTHESEARPEPMPLTSQEIQQEHGIPEKNQRIVKEYTEVHDLLIEVRPTNVDSVPHLQEGAMPKPMDVKDKTINQDDVDLGAPEWAKGLVGRFEPGRLKLPEEGTVSPERMEQLRDRLAKRDKDFEAYRDHMQRLGARYRVTDDGIVEGLFKGKYQPITGDHDLFDIRHADGTRLTADELRFHEEALVQLDAGIQHGPHVYWEPASEFQRTRNFEDIVNKHQHDAPPNDREPLVQFRPHDQPLLEWAEKNVTGVDREMIPWHVNGKLDMLHAEQLRALNEVTRNHVDESHPDATTDDRARHGADRRQQLDSDIARLRDSVDELTNHPDFAADTYRALVNKGFKTPIDLIVEGRREPMLFIDRGGEFEPILARIDGPEHQLATLRQKVEAAIVDGTHPADILRALEDRPTTETRPPLAESPEAATELGRQLKEVSRTDPNHRPTEENSGPAEKQRPHGDEPQRSELADAPAAPEAPQHNAERTDAGLSFHPNDPELAELARRVTNDPDYVTVDVHITEDGNIRVGDRTYTPEEFGGLLRQLGYDGSTPIRLIGCDAASNEVAARLAFHLDTDVLAPTKPAWTDRQGRVYTSTSELDSNGNRRPRIPPDGEWRVVHPDGTQTKASQDGFAPGTHPEDKPSIDPDSARDRSTPSDAELRHIIDIYNALGEDPPRVNISENDAAYAASGAHSVERHSSDVPLNRGDAPPGDRTIEGRIYGDPPWGRPENWSYRWSDMSTMNRTINDYLEANWESIRTDIALTGEHSATFDAGHRTGEGFYNEGMYGAGQRSAHYAQTSYATVRLKLVPGSPPTFMVITAFPAGLP
ncbi:hypothetical protein OHB26_06845 [Nocardia sp. NBC_01503]|uniref:WXG100-like domain-containing protein n=1 Tax=Nocardia sp. NBC_01503 TaxID=2975997 RepID=UPI002E7B94E8|nr:ADP-ribosyltransferase [Nocardia sp. NBC_01503]WTL33927.1 hypothetical protein OHB26_06845 [Nocardia sp. NBC_01503]